MRGIGRRNFLSSFYLKKWQMLFKPKAKEEKPEEGNRSGVLGMSSILLKATESNHKVLRWRNHPDAKAILRILSVWGVLSTLSARHFQGSLAASCLRAVCRMWGGHCSQGWRGGCFQMDKLDDWQCHSLPQCPTKSGVRSHCFQLCAKSHRFLILIL